MARSPRARSYSTVIICDHQPETLCLEARSFAISRCGSFAAFSRSSRRNHSDQSLPVFALIESSPTAVLFVFVVAISLSLEGTISWDRTLCQTVERHRRLKRKERPANIAKTLRGTAMSEIVIEVPAEWKRRAYIDAAKYEDMYRNSIADPEGFWGNEARKLDWIRPFSKVKDVSFDTKDLH